MQLSNLSEGSRDERMGPEPRQDLSVIDEVPWFLLDVPLAQCTCEDENTTAVTVDHEAEKREFSSQVFVSRQDQSNTSFGW